jgi:hypothetical protein
VEGDLASTVAPFPIAPAEPHFALVIVSVGIDEAAETVWQSVEEGAFVVAAVGIVVFAIAVRFAV